MITVKSLSLHVLKSLVLHILHAYYNARQGVATK